MFFQNCTLVYRNSSGNCGSSIIYKTLDVNTLLEQVIGKSVTEITYEVLSNFMNISFLEDHKWKSSKFSYAQLIENIKRRTCDFKNNRISTQRMEELSLNIDDVTMHIVAEKECSICQKIECRI